MASRRKRPMRLNDMQIDEFMEAATRLHRACRDPRLNTMGEDYRTLRNLNQAICEAIRKITGKEPPWAGPNSKYGATIGKIDSSIEPDDSA